MKKDVFLNKAVEQAFLYPVFDTGSCLHAEFNENTANNIIISDLKQPYLTSFIISSKQIKKYLKELVSDVHNNQLLEKEYFQYKHYMSENIIVPDNYAGTDEMRKKYKLLQVSRQAAQKKRITAVLFPVEFDKNIEVLQEQYMHNMQKNLQLLKQNPLSVDMVLINDFAAFYRRIIRKFNIAHFGYWINRKRFLYYLNEAAQLLKNQERLADDFCKTHTFYGSNCKWCRKHALFCSAKLQELLLMLEKMRHNRQLLDLVQDMLVGYAKYRESIKKYKEKNNINNVKQISDARQLMQVAFNKFAYLQYLQGVYLAFEYKYLDDCPVTQHQALPTVSPLDEMKKIALIAESRTKIHLQKGKIFNLYAKSLQEGKEAIQALVLPAEKMD